MIFIKIFQAVFILIFDLGDLDKQVFLITKPLIGRCPLKIFSFLVFLATITIVLFQDLLSSPFLL